jgi:hypothetical protein
MDEHIAIPTISWEGPEYPHKEKSADFIWTIGIITLILVGVVMWFGNYLFAVFILISGASLIFFSLRSPEVITFSIETKGFVIGKDTYSWKALNGFHITRGEPYANLLIETNRKFLPIFTIPLPHEHIQEVRTTLLEVIPNIDIQESRAMLFMERLGF